MNTKVNISGFLRAILVAAIMIFALLYNAVRAQTMGLNGQAIGWTTLNPAEPFQAQAGLRYIPELSFSIPAGNYSFDGEFSANLWGSTIFSSDSIDIDSEIFGG